MVRFILACDGGGWPICVLSNHRVLHKRTICTTARNIKLANARPLMTRVHHVADARRRM